MSPHGLLVRRGGREVGAPARAGREHIQTVQIDDGGVDGVAYLLRVGDVSTPPGSGATKLGDGGGELGLGSLAAVLGVI